MTSPEHSLRAAVGAPRGRLLARPRRLRSGDRVAVVTPSSSVTTRRRLERGLRALRQAGLEPVPGALADVSGPHSAEARADEINTALRDSDCAAIVVTIGGYSTNGVLEMVDWHALRAAPRVLVGYSDVTALLNAAVARAGVVTFHGPTLLPEFGEFPAPLGVTRQSFRRAVGLDTPEGPPVPLGQLCAPELTTDEFLAWDVDDDRPRRLRAAAPWEWSGDPRPVRGPLLGGNLDTLTRLVGTAYLPDLDGAVLLLESAGDSLDVAVRELTHLRHAGVLAAVRGIVLGRCFRCPPGMDDELLARLRHLLPPGMPVVSRVDVGHTDPMLTLPLGVDVVLDVGTRRLEVVDAAVR